MHSVLRKSWPARLSALGFIAVIILGNVWLTYGITHQPVPEWLGVGMASGIAVTLFGGACLVGLTIWYRIHPVPEVAEPNPEASSDAPDV